MKPEELISALEGANINSESAEVIAAKFIDFLYVRMFVEASVSLLIIGGIVYGIYRLVKEISESTER